MRISVDAMGGDNAPHAIVEGCLMAAARKPGYSIQMIGDESQIEALLAERGAMPMPGGLELLHASERILADESPTRAIKEKKDSSIAVGLRLVRDGQTDSFLSCGNTGALLSGAMLIAGRMEGVDRPALAPMVPTATGRSMLIDAGLNASLKPVNYEQFAQIGSMYMKEMFGIERPRVGLLNVGTESNKGTEPVKEAYARLSALPGLNFIGNIEGRDLTEGRCDVAVCDGFVGNIALKLYESVGAYIKSGIKEALSGNPVARIASSLIRKDLRAFFKKFDYEEYGGTPILGVGGSVFKGHGNSSAKAVMFAIECAAAFAKTSVLEQIRERFSPAGA